MSTTTISPPAQRGDPAGPLRIEQVPVEDLRLSGYNPRTMSDAERAKLERSIAEFGMVDPLVARREDRELIGGHQRLVAARGLGMTTVPVVFLDVTAERAKLISLALNKIQGTWDEKLLARLLGELDAVPDLDLTVTGFDDDDIRAYAAMLDAEPLADKQEDFDLGRAIAAAREHSRARRGEAWELGRHRLMCGDATSAADMARLCAGDGVNIVVSDPPYSIDYVPAGERAGRASATRPVLGPILNDAMAPEDYQQLLEGAFGNARRRHARRRRPLSLWMLQRRRRVRAGLRCRGHLPELDARLAEALRQPLLEGLPPPVRAAPLRLGRGQAARVLRRPHQHGRLVRRARPRGLVPPPHPEAHGALRARAREQLPPRTDAAGHVRRRRGGAHRGGAHGPALPGDGAGRAVLRSEHPALGAVHGPERAEGGVMGTRRTREEAMKLEDAAVRLSVRGCSARQIAGVLGLSESEARRKLRQGFRRRQRQDIEAGASARVAAELSEVRRAGWEGLERAPRGAPASVGFLKVILDTIEREAYLQGLELRKVGLPPRADDGTMPGPA